ncbi:MAG: 16S rRNA (cytidine(1402)-2'-O)-methyltransferase [Gammaproteobacteria bacterium]|nr:16S rRNA (cytidine(1402)-2'-O)-methyltransferase [Gammaproteobacteria bacterium]MCY4229225.1 16S rRNA (cytidine(1402)-2'-O)-methyltransferase [Gammaproteobacteria bacterium]
MDSSGILYVVATPIGNLSDLSERARSVISEADLVLCEDTRRTARLLQAYGISARARSFHDHNENKLLGWVVQRLWDGQDIALVSDAGTPLISDPGFSLVREVHRQGLRVSPVPGPNAAIAALSVSGVPCHRFCFEGFLPSQAKRRQNALRALRNESRTLVFYESSHRIEECLKDMANVLGWDRPVMIGREITKIHETFFLGSLDEALHFTHSDENQRKGEFVLVVGGNPDVDLEWQRACELLERLGSSLPASEASRIVSETFSVNRKRLYRRMIEQKKN